MNYHLDLFTPETWATFRNAGATVTGFRERQRRVAERVEIGDIFLCYLTKVSRWCGALKVQSHAYVDDTPILDDPDPFTVRFKVEPIVLLDPESAIPIREEPVWQTLTMTKQYVPNRRGWTGFFRNSLNTFEDEDGRFLMNLLQKQQENPEHYALTDRDRRQLASLRVIAPRGEAVEVDVPEAEDLAPEPGSDDGSQYPEVRESIKYQAKVAQIGAEMGFSIWVPRSDKARVLAAVPPAMHDRFLDRLPLNHDETTIRTVEQIDVLWMKGRSMARAFEVEHTTAIYSGLLRMADLLALQPNINIRLHIVAPTDRAERVLQEIRRPVFALLERGPLYEQCSFLSYDSIDELAGQPHLTHISDSILDEYEESAEV